jgi:hypothetical protein
MGHSPKASPKCCNLVSGVLDSWFLVLSSTKYNLSKDKETNGKGKKGEIKFFGLF